MDRKDAGEILGEMVRIVRSFRSSGQRSRERSVTGTKMGVLQVLRLGDARLGEIATNLAVSAPVASRAVDALEAEQLLQRRRDTLDARALLISITSAGLEALANREAYVVSRFAEALDDWSPDESAQAIAMLRKLNLSLDEVLAGLEPAETTTQTRAVGTASGDDPQPAHARRTAMAQSEGSR